MMRLSPLHDTPSLSERAYEAIKEAILSLEIRPGEVLSIGQLAGQLGVSRTPVRDALLLLEKDGLVTLLPQKGARVSEISNRDIEETYELRVLLESYAAKVAAARLTPGDLEQMETVLQEAEQAFERGERVAAADLGRQIHDLLIEKVGNERLLAFLDDLETHYTRIRRFAPLIPGRFAKSHEQHKKILAALQNGDAEGAEQAMFNHLSSVRDDILANADLWTKYLGSGEKNVPTVGLPEPLFAHRLD